MANKELPEHVMKDLQNQIGVIESYATVKKGDKNKTLTPNDLKKAGKLDDLLQIMLDHYKLLCRCQTSIELLGDDLENVTDELETEKNKKTIPITEVKDIIHDCLPDIVKTVVQWVLMECIRNYSDT